MNPTTAALLLAIPLMLLGAASAVMQVRSRRLLDARTHVPSDERSYLEGRHRRRLLAGLLMIVAGGMIAGAHLFGLEATADHLKAGTDAAGNKQDMTPDDKRFVRFWGAYWIGVILIASALVVVAIVDAWASRRYWHGVYRELKVEHEARLRRDLAVYRRQKDDRGAHRGPL